MSKKQVLDFILQIRGKRCNQWKHMFENECLFLTDSCMDGNDWSSVSRIKTRHLSTEMCTYCILVSWNDLLPSKCMCISSVCLWIHFPCALSLQSWSIIPVTGLRLDPHRFVHLGAGEQQQVLLTDPLMPLHVTGGLLMYMFTLSYMLTSASTRVCTYECVWECLNVMQ